MKLRWHEALAYGLLGVEVGGLGRQEQPDLGGLADDLQAAYGGHAELVAAVSRVRAAAPAWPIPVPAGLRDGLGAAQLGAAQRELRERLNLDDQQRRTVGDRPLDPAEQALQREVPPHH